MQDINGTNKINTKKAFCFRYRFRRFLSLIFSLFIVFIACVCQSEKTKSSKNDPEPTSPLPDPLKNSTIDSIVSDLKFDTSQMKKDLNEFTKEPHPLGSKRQIEIASWLEAQIKESKFRSLRQSFEATVPNPDALTNPMAPITIKKEGHNIFAFQGYPKKLGCAVVLASHYDTKIVPEVAYVGANDGGSSTIALLQLLRELSNRNDGPQDTFLCEVMFVWFDGEEAVLLGWSDGLFNHPAKILDNTYGSRFLASLLTQCTFQGVKSYCLPKELGGQTLAALIVLDMIGSPQVKLIKDSFSSPWMLENLIKIMKSLDLDSILEKNARGVEDDHVPFVKLGVSAIDLIDFTNLNYWHQAGDTSDKISFESIIKVSKIGLKLALDIAQRPKDFLNVAEERIGN